MILSTAKSSVRELEIGIRKVVGSKRIQLVFQHLVEAIIYSVMAFLLALALTELLIPAFSHLSGKPLSSHSLTDWYIIPALMIFTVLVGLISGLYPAFYLTSINPVSLIKSTIKSGKAAGYQRKILVIFQFAISIALIIASGFVYEQLQYMRNKDLGFDRERLICIRNMPRLEYKQLAFKEELKRLSSIENIAYGYMVPGIRSFIMTHYYKSKGDYDNDQNRFGRWQTYADYDFLSTLGLEIIAGRDFPLSFGTDVSNSIIINEAAARALGWDNPVGNKVYMSSSREVENIDENKKEDYWKQGEYLLEDYVAELEIIGVVKDYHHHSLHQEIEPMLFSLRKPWQDSRVFSNLIVRANNTDFQRTLQQIEDIWKKFAPKESFTYAFIDKSFEAKYQEDIRFGQIVILFTVLTIFIACLGIFGLIAFTAERRTKEIGIRKILGASVSNIIVLLTKETTRWVLFSCIIAIPIGYFAVSKWLQNFAYRIDLGISYFILACLVAFLIALLTVSSQAFRAARANPVDSLRYE
jgi:putative ABC transport system permease protein